MGVRSACRYASFVVCHPAPPSQRVQFVDTTMMMPTATMNMRIRHANSNTLFQSIPGLAMDQFHFSASLPSPQNHLSARTKLTKHFLRTALSVAALPPERLLPALLILANRAILHRPID